LDSPAAYCGYGSSTNGTSTTGSMGIPTHNDQPGFYRPQDRRTTIYAPHGQPMRAIAWRILSPQRAREDLP
jgi:hypothetical protein